MIATATMTSVTCPIVHLFFDVHSGAMEGSACSFSCIWPKVGNCFRQCTSLDWCFFWVQVDHVHDSQSKPCLFQGERSHLFRVFLSLSRSSFLLQALCLRKARFSLNSAKAILLSWQEILCMHLPKKDSSTLQLPHLRRTCRILLTKVHILHQMGCWRKVPLHSSIVLFWVFPDHPLPESPTHTLLQLHFLCLFESFHLIPWTVSRSLWPRSFFCWWPLNDLCYQFPLEKRYAVHDLLEISWQYQQE